MKKVIFILFIGATFTSCLKSKEASKIVVGDWLLGKWENKSSDGNLSETWKKANDSVYNGESYFIKGKDTLHFENIQLKQKKEDLFYISTIKGENNDEAVEFKMTNSTEKQLLFENPKHDYPKKISYTLVTPDNLAIEISGIQQGKPSVQKYSMKKVK